MFVQKAFKEHTFGEVVSSECGGRGGENERMRGFLFAFQNWLDLNWLKLTKERVKRTVQIKE